MNATFACGAALLALGIAQTAIGQQDRLMAASQVSLCATTSFGTCGAPCEPFQCPPTQNQVSGGAPVLFDVGGRPGAVYVLFTGAPRQQGCQPVPQVQGSIAVDLPAVVVAIGYLPDLPGKHWCGQANTTVRVDVPPVPAGVDARFQVLSLDEYARQTGPVLAFSRAVELQTR